MDPEAILGMKTLWMVISITAVPCVKIVTFWTASSDADFDVMVFSSGLIEAFSPAPHIACIIFLALSSRFLFGTVKINC